jgi:hypothetical protein
MSILSTGAGKTERRKPQRQQPLDTENDNQVLTFGEWCKLNRLSERTGRRILKSDSAPIITRLSTRLIGITVGNNKAWQAERARGGAVR